MIQIRNNDLKTIFFTGLSYFLMVLTASMCLLTLPACNFTYQTINPELTHDTRHFTIYKENKEIFGKSVFVINDSSRVEPIEFTSDLSSESKKQRWSLNILPKVSLQFDRTHSFEVAITNSADARKRTLLYLVDEEADGKLSSALGDTILILEANERTGYFLVEDFLFYPVLPLLQPKQFEVELNKIRTTIRYRCELPPQNDWFTFHYDNEYLAAVGNMEVKSFGNFKYHFYIRNNVSTEFQKDLFFLYVATRAISRIQSEIEHLQRKN